MELREDDEPEERRIKEGRAGGVCLHARGEERHSTGARMGKGKEICFVSEECGFVARCNGTYDRLMLDAGPGKRDGEEAEAARASTRLSGLCR
jgi:hypothetical protein